MFKAVLSCSRGVTAAALDDQGVTVVSAVAPASLQNTGTV